jgi:4-hydroxybenzoate polyprenyltransferase
MHELAGAVKENSTGVVPGGTDSSGFVYVCHAEDEIPIDLYNRLAGVVLVDSGKKKRHSAHEKHKIEKIIAVPRPGWIEYVKAVRIHQWIKNLLVFVPLITAHQITDVALLSRAALAFAAFSLCASGVYLLNDLFDIQADRKHPNKSGRPLAAGNIAVNITSLLVPFLTFIAVLIGAFLGATFVTILFAYLGITALYSIWLKRIVVVDVVLLAALYTVRIFAGGAAVAIMPSFWLLSFSMFIFFSLALMKRSSDLYHARTSEQNIMAGRGYVADDARIVQNMGTASGYMSVLVMALYINSDEVQLLYSQPWILWFICPLLLYWISRVWVIASRGLMREDPILFTIRDWVSYAVAIIACVILWLAS